MEFKFNVTGTQRKKLVMAISEILNTASEYQGPPTYAYEVGGYRIDRAGTLTGADSWELIADLSGLHSLVPTEGTYDTALAETQAVDENVVIPWEAELGGRVSPYRDYEEPPAYSTMPDRLVIEMPAEGFTDETFDNLQKLVASKSSLIKKAIGAENLNIERTEETLSFPWFTFNPDNGKETRAYTQLIAALCEMAKTQKRVIATEKPVDNEKYAFRCFLLRLGFIGAEYKEERKILLSKLTGSSAFKNPAKGGSDDE